MIKEDLGTWYKNVTMKPLSILDAMEKYPELDIVSIDADAEVLEYPKVFDKIPKEVDIAYHLLNWNEWYGYSKNPPIMELLTGTMYLRNNDKIKKLCNEWYSEATKTNEWEQKVLQRIIKKYDIKHYHLPLSYCYMKTRPRNKEPLVKLENPVIVHNQVSRKLKRKLK